ncbi:MAG: DNA mismatch repair endonuclease MutL [Clostridiales bacterium]|nr:DNA mismatch repair endonuclease MutL [Clostridiales bacterium]
MAIRILSAETASRIAAGEVVERPASIVKELFENALDAGARAIAVEIKNGGIEYIRVTDNGCGIPPEEVLLAFQNHATSKLQSPEELNDIRTMGFRGEALPSVAAVARVECRTREKGAASGMSLVIEGGALVSRKETGCPEGTTIIVRDLFFNTPARRTFLKRPAYEAAVVTETLEKLLLANPWVAVKLISNGRTVYHSYGDGNLRHAAMAVYGRERAGALMAVEEREGALSLEGLIGVGDCARPTRSGQSVFVNGRVVRCPLVVQALEQAAKGRVTVGMHPMCILHMRISPALVDVNVHPSKLELRFREEGDIRIALDAMFTRAFEGERMLDLAADPVPALGKVTVVLEQPKGAAGPEAEGEKQSEAREASGEQLLIEIPERSRGAALRESARTAVPLIQRPGEPPHPQEAEAPRRPKPQGFGEGRETAGQRPVSSVPAGQAGPGPAEAREEEKTPVFYRVLGVAFHTYILIETEDALLMIDQHAAHERILYEGYARQLETGSASQPLLTPLVVEASPREIERALEAKDLLKGAGFDVEAFGTSALVVRAVPYILGKADVTPLFAKMLDRLDQLRYATREKRLAELIQTACRHAVKGGDPLHESEIEALIREMQATKAPPTCPHGRPVVRRFSRGELERLFKRQQ